LVDCCNAEDGYAEVYKAATPYEITSLKFAIDDFIECSMFFTEESVAEMKESYNESIHLTCNGEY